ncbi:MAG: tRNA (adenosine(37)-N6)-dimethylallyltransferase MiaA [Rhizobiales bacterium]|nr:tRNA (adenosine(37)-N6)-dimethylallyltransferase MiaA [Hyphomicrobiales bacterium]
MKHDAILIAGPTASGKTGLAIELAKRHNGAIINTDSMQVYDILSVLTARPQPEEMQGIPHLLFGHVHPSELYSTAKWIKDVQNALAKIRDMGKVPIFAGGTGLYFKALLEGLSPIPDIDIEVRNKWRSIAETAKEGVLHEKLKSLDAAGSKKIKVGDTQRLVRAIEVIDGTGKPLNYWQAQQNKTPLLSGNNCQKIVLLPSRELLRERAELRFQQMVEQGALEEVRVLMALNLSNDLPAMRAIGVKFIGQYLEKQISLDKASELSINATRQYSKRQGTWFRNQFDDNWNAISCIVDLPQP